MSFKLSAIVILGAASLSTVAVAQTTTPAPAKPAASPSTSAAPAAATPAPALTPAAIAAGQVFKVCKAPEMRDKLTVTGDEMQTIGESGKAYVECMQPLIEAKRKRAQELADQANAEAQASNAAIIEVNGFVEAFRAFQFKHKGDK